MAEKPPRIALILTPLSPFPDDGRPVPWECRVRKALKLLLRAYGLRNALFVHPEELERNPSLWRQVEPLAGFSASETEPPF